MEVRDIMVRMLVCISEDQSLEAAARLMLDRGVGCLLVTGEGGSLLGIITESDFTGKKRGFPFSAYSAPQILGEWIGADGLEGIYAAARTRQVGDVMTRHVITATEGESLTALAVRMIERRLHRVPVVRDGNAVGIVTRRDLLKAMVEIAGASRSESQD